MYQLWTSQLNMNDENNVTVMFQSINSSITEFC